jgi:hypothetical protein
MLLMLTIAALRTLLPQIGIVVCFLLMGTWLRFTFAPTVYPSVYISRFVVFSAMLITIAVWFACGMPGFAALHRSRARAWMLLCLLVLAIWAYASQGWGFAAARAPQAGSNAALAWCVVALFCVVVASAAPPHGWIVGAVLVSAALNAVLAVAQVANGGALGLHALGEFRFGGEIDGTSLIEAGDITFVRPYGLLAHPNMLGGLLVVGVLLAATYIVSRPHPPTPSPDGEGENASQRHGIRDHVATDAKNGVPTTDDPVGTPFLASALRKYGVRAILISLLALLLYGLLLTFSRAAWLALAAGGVAWMGMVFVRRRGAGAQTIAPLRTFVVPLIVSLLVGGLFLAQYRPLIGARVGEGAESLELRSVSDRLVYTDFALRAIEERPLIGQGAGYFPWRAAAYLRETFFDLRGDHVHQVFLSVWAELGLVGFALLCAALCLGVEAALRAGAGGLRAGLLASVLALAVVGLFDHYPYSQLPFMALWWGLLAASGNSEASR